MHNRKYVLTTAPRGRVSRMYRERLVASSRVLAAATVAVAGLAAAAGSTTDETSTDGDSHLADHRHGNVGLVDNALRDAADDSLALLTQPAVADVNRGHWLFASVLGDRIGRPSGE